MENENGAERRAENILAFAPEQLRETQADAISIETIRKMLDKSAFYTAEFLLLDCDKNEFTVKVTYRYLDGTKTTIIMAQHRIVSNTAPVLRSQSEVHI